MSRCVTELRMVKQFEFRESNLLLETKNDTVFMKLQVN